MISTESAQNIILSLFRTVRLRVDAPRAALAWKLRFELELGWSSQIWDHPGGREGTVCPFPTWSACPLVPQCATVRAGQGCRGRPPLSPTEAAPGHPAHEALLHYLQGGNGGPSAPAGQAPPPPEWELGVQGARVKGTHRSRSLSGDFLACVCLLCSVPRNPRSSESKQAF